MIRTGDDVWQPRASELNHSCIMEIIRLAGQENFDDLHAYSIREPEAYWRLINEYLGIVWRKDYSALCDLSRGPEFPSWFVGGELNWTDTILNRADDPAFAHKLAIAAEREDGRCNRVTYAELRDLVVSVATGLHDAGVRRGDRIGLLMENGVEASAALLALSYLGAIVVPLFSGFGADPATSRLEAAGARGLIATSGFHRRGRFIETLPVIEEVASRLPGLELIFIKHSSGAPGGAVTPRGWIDWAEIATPATKTVPSETMSPDDPFMVAFTSGTTGSPKGIVHTHGGFPIKIAHDAAQNFNIKASSTFCWPADMGWIAGALVLSAVLMRGATLICYDGGPDYPDWSRMAKLIEAHRITHFGSAPTLIRGFAAHPELATSADLSTVELLITAGEVIAPEHFLWFQRHFGRGEVPVINYTGGTEVSGALLGNVVVKPIVPSGFNARSAGVDVDVLNLNGEPVTGEVGELAIRQPFVGMTCSFWRDDERYLETYWRTLPELWVHGDLAMRDAEGNYFLLGRSDDTIKVAGKRVGPAEVEEILVEIEGIEEAAVIGAEDAEKGQAIIAFVISSHADADDRFTATIRQRVQERLGKPFAPREVYKVPQLPKTRSSKVMRRIIRDAYAGRTESDLASIVNPEAIDEIRSVLRTA